MPKPTASRAVRLAPSLVLVLALACGDETLNTPQPPEPSQLYWDLQLNHRAVTLSTRAPYDTLTLVATPRNIAQEPLTGLSAPRYTSDNGEYVVVTDEGELVALRATAPDAFVKVTATLTAANLKHSDYVLVRVVDDPELPVLATFSVHPVPPDSAKVALTRSITVKDTLPMRATDATGAPITDLLVSFRAAGTRPHSLSTGTGNEFLGLDEITGEIVGLLPGTTTINAVTTLFGVTKADTLRYRIGLPITGVVVVTKRSDGTPGSTAPDPVLTLATGAAVAWNASIADTTMDLDITFTDPTHVASFPGSSVYPYATTFLAICDIQAFVFGPAAVNCTNGGNFVLPVIQNPFTGSAILGTAVRTFPVPGTYVYRSVGHGLEGRIVIIDESEP